MSEDYDRFKLWYLEPLHALEAMPSGQGGFVALATACFLYERYAVAILTFQDKKADRAGKVSQLGKDFNIDETTAEIFWKVIRDGLLHQGMPLQVKNLPGWGFHHTYPAIALDNTNDRYFLKVQPWKFTDRVLQLWEANFNLLQSSGSFPWATIGSVPS